MAEAPVREPDAPQSRPSGRRWLFLVILVVVLVALGCIFGPDIYYANTHENTDDAFIDGHIVQVAPKVGGEIVAVHVKDNQMVHKGDLLVEIDPSDYKAAYDSAAAGLKQAQAREKSSSISVGLTRTTSGATVQQASAGVEESQQAATVADAAVSTASTQVQSYQSAVEAARGKLAQAQDEIRTAERDVQGQQDTVRAAQADATRAATDYQRYVSLWHQDATSKQTVDQAAATAKMTRANLDAARAKVQSLRDKVAEQRGNAAQAEGALHQAESQAAEAQSRVSEAQARAGQAHSAISEAEGRLAQANSAPEQVAVSRAQVHTASADVLAATAQLEQAKIRLDDTKVYAPEDGRVTKKSAEVGQVLQVGQTLMALVSPNVWVTANFKETQLAKMRPGAAVKIVVEAYPGVDFSGRVDSIQAGSGAAFSLLPPENATGNYVKVVQRVPVKIVFDNIPKDIILGPGMSVVPYVETR